MAARPSESGHTKAAEAARQQSSGQIRAMNKRRSGVGRVLRAGAVQTLKWRPRLSSKRTISAHTATKAMAKAREALKGPASRSIQPKAPA